MPKQYEAMRDKFAGEGLDYDKAQEKAAKIFNSKAKSKGMKPVGPGSDKKSGGKKPPPKKRGR